MKSKNFRAIGLMSGTSLDGIDAALLETDGHNYVRPLGFLTVPYEATFREKLRCCLGSKKGTADKSVALIEQELTELHVDLVAQCRSQFDGPIDLIGFHGQTLWHEPLERLTIQVGDGALLAKKTGIAVINDFRSADVKAGGQGAPLVPLYHRALAAQLPKPLAILNIGGVSNVTWIGGDDDDDLLAFDVGPGNAMIDDWVFKHTGKAFDADGVAASIGKVHQALLEEFLAFPFFEQKPPKSLDRDAFKHSMELDLFDGAATLTMVTAQAVALSIKHMPHVPTHMYVTGGGRLNKVLMRWIRDLLNRPVSPVDDLGWDGDALEAQAFAYLAVRSYLELPLSLPGTTGVPCPMKGGRLHKV